VHSVACVPLADPCLGSADAAASAADIVGFIAKFLGPLLDLFAFYAKRHLLQTSTGVKQFHMAYADYQRFINTLRSRISRSRASRPPRCLSLLVQVRRSTTH
jgi:hypothetical protein